MSNEFALYEDSFVAGADLRLKQRYGVKISAVDTIVLIAAATDRAIGVLQNKPNIGEPAEVMVLGKSRVISDGSGTAIAAGDPVGFSADGIVVKKATDNDACCGISYSVSAAAGVIITVFLIPYYTYMTVNA